ncbi:MAG: SDR family NAD(P)-dependent oxidoreductase, partial [Rhodobacteraceae bacterium]|nr:SDR family NAD(P)-dependent oxidoreductase [Paracoccaceae bacterium]
DIRALWLPEPGAEDAAAKRLLAPSVQLPLIMICEYALAQLWMSWGVTPSALIGHSMGENTAACLAGTMTFEACIGLVHLRGVLMDGVEKGGMLSVALPAKELQAYLGDALDLAVVNGPSLSVASGAVAGLDALQKRLEEQGIDCQRIAIDIAAHSRLLDPILEEFGGYLRGMDLKAPQIPIISNRTGIALTDAEAMDPDYWIGHLRGTVRFADGLTTLSENPERIYIEVGPGKALSSLAGQHDKLEANQVTSSLRHQKDVIADDAYFMTMLARVWAMGGHIDWAQIWGEARRNRVVLPSYPFQHQTYFIEPGQAVSADESEWLMRVDDRDQWGWQPGWQPEYAKCNIDVSGDLSDMPVQNWLIFNDDAGVAAPMVERLRKAGQNVTSVTTGDAFARLSDDTFVLAPERGREGYDQLIAELTALGRLPQRIAHFWLVTADEKHRPGGSFFHRVQEQGFWSLFYLMQALAAESADSDLHLLSVTSGAMQVRDERLAYPSKATIAGPIRVIPREFPDVTSSQLDIELGPKGKLSAEQAEALLEELLAEPANVTAALRGNRRYRLGWKRAALDFDAQLADLPLKQGATVLLTGGFGGIGLTVAQALISRYRANIVLIGRQELPERDEWSNYLRNVAPNDRVARRIRAVQGLEEAGGQVLTLAADVSNIEEMRAAVAKAEDRFGQISGVVHGAGVIDDAPILAKTSMGIEDVFTPKIHGTQVIDALFADGTLDFLALFSSSSTATAPAGQVDYVAANEYLNGFAKARAGFKTKVVAINWGIWNGVGMAAEAMQARTSRAAPPQKPVDQPLLDFAGFDDAGNRIFAATWQADKNWVLNEHRVLSGDALLPGTGYLELAAEALAAQGEHGPFEVLDLTFLQPLRADDGVETAVRVTLPRTNTGYSFSVQSAGPGAAMGLNAEAELSLLPLARPDRLDIDEIAARLAAPLAAPTGGSLRSPQEAHLRFGPRWNVLQETRLGKGEGLARLRLPLAAQGDSAYALHPGLLDLATGWAMELIEGYEAKNLWVPVSYGSVRVYGPLPADLVSYVKITQNAASGSDFATFSIVLAAADGAVALEADGFTIRRLDGALRFGAASPANAVSDGPIPLSAAEERLQHNLSQGISADEGASAFFAALGAGRSQIVVTSLDLPALIAQAEASGQSNADTGQSFERPELDNDFAAPETDIEKRLAGFWQELLGLAQVGIDDSFFDLGGHSLIAVRLFAMVKKGYAVDFPISILFEAPTIRKCAALIAAQGGTDTAEAAPQGAAPARPASRFTHLVPMHQGEGGSKTPFFLVAGMFGNVLNLRHLAHLLGADRPFYGLQARGLLGEEQPHTSLVGAARDMIVEIKAVQAQGPYMVGGFSGGGITAYEIARQLKEAGDETSVLVMLDTPLPIRQPLSRADRAAIQWAEAKAGGIAYPFNWAIRRVRWEFEKRKVKTDEGSAAPQFHNAAIEAAFLGAIDAYQLQDWDGPLTLLRPPLVGKWEVAPGRWVNDERAYVLPDNDWTSHAPKIEVFEVPGDHDSMVLEPNVRVLAARMRHVIEAAETARLPSRLARWSQKKAAE